MDYYKKKWINKYKEAFNYYDLIHDVIKLENNYINKNGNKDSENKLISILKSLNKVYLTNNICESIHAKIAKHIPESKITKNSFRDTIDFIIKDYNVHMANCIRKDYISRTLIIITEKYNLNGDRKIIDYETYNK